MCSGGITGALILVFETLPSSKSMRFTEGAVVVYETLSLGLCVDE